MKVSVATTLKRSRGGRLAVHPKALPGRLYDGHTVAAVEPVIGHIKHGHRIVRNFLDREQGDVINPILAAAGYNVILILKWIRFLCCGSQLQRDIKSHQN